MPENRPRNRSLLKTPKPRYYKVAWHNHVTIVGKIVKLQIFESLAIPSINFQIFQVFRIRERQSVVDNAGQTYWMPSLFLLQHQWRVCSFFIILAGCFMRKYFNFISLSPGAIKAPGAVELCVWLREVGAFNLWEPPNRIFLTLDQALLLEITSFFIFPSWYW